MVEIGTTPRGSTWTLKMRKKSRWRWVGRVHMTQEHCLPMMADEEVTAFTRARLISRVQAVFDRKVESEVWGW